MPTVITENRTIAFAVQAWLAVWIEQHSLRQWQRVLSAMWSSWLRAFKVVPCSYRRTTSFLKEGMYSFGMIVLPLYPIRKSFQVNTRYSDNTADFPLQRRTTKQEVKKHESERSVLFLHPRQTSFRQNRPFHITRFPASKRTSPYVRHASVLADYKSNHDQMLIFFRKQYGRYRNFPVRCMISYDFLKIYSLLINFAADVI